MIVPPNGREKLSVLHLTTSSYFVIVGGATMATAATTASLGNIHQSLARHPLHITFGIPLGISSIAKLGNTERCWFNLPQHNLFGPTSICRMLLLSSCGFSRGNVSHTIYASTSPVILDFRLHNYYSYTKCL